MLQELAPRTFLLSAFACAFRCAIRIKVEPREGASMGDLRETARTAGRQATARKYRLVGPSLTYQDRKLHRIQALRDMPEIGVRIGDVGGYVQGYNNLSHEGMCWVFGNGKVFDRARLLQNAQVRDYGKACDCAQVSGNARIRDHAEVSGDAWLTADAQARDHARVYDSALLLGQAEALDHSEVYGRAFLTGYVKARDHAQVYDDASLRDQAQACDHSQIMGHAQLCGFARTYGYLWVSADQIISGDAVGYAESPGPGAAVEGPPSPRSLEPRRGPRPAPEPGSGTVT
jgi:hypothetical protein